MNKTSITPQEANKKYKRFKKLYFKGKTSFSGLELEECRKKFLERYTIK